MHRSLRIVIVNTMLTAMRLQSEQLDLSKAKATDLLRAHDGDTLKAMVQWVSSAV